MAEEEKKGGKISGFFKNIGNKIGDATYDMRSDGEFDKLHPAYTVYTGAELLSHTAEFHAEEHIEEGYILARGEDDVIKSGDVVVKNDGDEAYYIAEVQKAEISFEFEGKSSQKPALKIILGAPAQKVEVIKAGDVYYLKK